MTDETLYLKKFLVLRYRNSRGGIIIGTTSGTSQTSLFVFCEEVLGYDLAGFFRRNSEQIQSEIQGTLETLLSAK